MIPEGVRRFRHLGISRGDFVVEIGSGNDPYWRSDLLVDKYVVDSTERPGGYTPLTLDRAFLVGDALKLPFADQSIDYLVARNILEHIIDVDTFLAEMMRVSKRGYITTPSALSEKLFGWLKHVWFISSEEEILRLRAKERTLYDADLSKLFHGLYAQDRSFRRFYRQNRHLFVMEHRWEDDIQYQIIGNVEGLQSIKTAQSDFNLENTTRTLERISYDNSLRRKIEGLGRRLASRSRLTQTLDVLDKLACPECHGALELNQNKLVCVGCDCRYPVVKDIPVLVVEASI